MATDTIASFTISSHVLGHNSVTLKWEYWSSITESNIIKLMVMINDTTVRPTSETGNLAWTKQDVELANISLKSATISNLIENENMVFYLAAIVNNGGTIETKYSGVTESITVVAAPVSVGFLAIMVGFDLSLL